jgi:two-component system sensor histidine kinase/response regulator
MSKLLKQLILSCFFLTFLSVPVLAQTSRVDELLGQLNKNNPDSVQIAIMRKLSAAYSAVDPLKKLYYANQYRLLGEKNGIDSVVSAGYLDMGISYGIRGNIDSALYFFQLGYEKAKASNYEIGIARSHANMGFAYDRLDRKKDAVKSYEQSLRLFRKLNIKKSINQSITNLGSLYFDLGEYETAENYFKQVLENLQETPNDQMGLAGVYFSLGNTSRKLNNPTKALSYYEESLAIREKIGDLNGIALSNWGIGVIYNNKEQFEKSQQYYEIALKHNRALKNLYQECVVLMSATHNYLGLKDYKKADESANLALSIAQQIKSKSLVAEIIGLLAEVKRAQNKLPEALKLQEEYIKKSDSLNKNEVRKEVIINDLNRLNTDNKLLTRDNKTIASKNTEYVMVISIITILLILVAILLALYYKRNAEKKSINVLLQKQKQEVADVNEELSALNEELTMQMDIVSAQNIELEKLNQIKNKFFSIVSHDLRSPMNSLKKLLELFRDGDLAKPELNKLTLRLEDTIYTTAAFLDNLLEWSKSQLDGMVVKPSTFNIHQMVQDNIKLMDYQLKLKEIAVKNEIPKDLTLFADPNMITVVVRNLLSNAIKFCKKGDQILFKAHGEANQVSWSITDNGPGISTKDQQNLFNLTHASSTGTAGEKGYHIGLILCKDMIEQNKGAITVDSELGRGTTFNVTLPNVSS